MTMTDNTAPASSRGGQTAPGLAEDMRRVIDLFADAPGGMIVTAGPEHRIVMLNAAYSAWIEHRDVIGLSAADAFPNLLELGFQRLLEKVYATGRKCTDNFKKTMRVVLDDLLPKWNYRVIP